MAITSVREIWSGRDSSYNESLQRTYTKVFRVITDVMATDPLFIEFAPGIPRMWASYVAGSTFDLGSIVRSVRTQQQEDDPFEWRVTVEYSSKTKDPAQQSQSGSGGEGNPGNESPFLKPAQVSWGAVHDTKIIERSEVINGVARKAIANSAGQPFQPRPTIDASRPIITVVRNEPLPFKDAYYDFWDTVNNAPFAGRGAREVKCASITGSRQFENNIPFVAVTFVFEVRLPDWDLHLIDQGPCVLVNGKLTPVVEGIPASGAILLDGSGAKLAAGLAPIIKDFYAYPEKDFSVLNLNLI